MADLAYSIEQVHDFTDDQIANALLDIGVSIVQAIAQSGSISVEEQVALLVLIEAANRISKDGYDVGELYQQVKQKFGD